MHPRQNWLMRPVNIVSFSFPVFFLPVCRSFDPAYDSTDQMEENNPFPNRVLHFGLRATACGRASLACGLTVAVVFGSGF